MKWWCGNRCGLPAPNKFIPSLSRPELDRRHHKLSGRRLWMRVDRSGWSELVEWDKNTIIHHAAILARDLRILGIVFSYSSNMLEENDERLEEGWSGLWRENM